MYIICKDTSNVPTYVFFLCITNLKDDPVSFFLYLHLIIALACIVALIDIDIAKPPTIGYNVAE